MTSGEWTGSMCLTEPHCGNRPGPDAHPRWSLGRRHLQADRQQGISSAPVTYDLAANIIHLVLGSLARCPAGIMGEFVSSCPFNVKPDGSLGTRNGIYCGGLEHKMASTATPPHKLC
jgi:hypothetical protein